MTGFVLDPRLEADTVPVGRLPLSAVRLMADATYPWLILVPLRAGACEVFDLLSADRALLIEEATSVGRVLSRVADDRRPADKINIAALGNVVAQLHVHVIARYRDDPAWPAPVWGRLPVRPYDPAAETALLNRLTAALVAECPGFVPELADKGTG